MEQHSVAREHLHWRQREPLHDFSPGVDKKSPNLVA
jgi:hypothetical protein